MRQPSWFYPSLFHLWTKSGHTSRFRDGADGHSQICPPFCRCDRLFRPFRWKFARLRCRRSFPWRLAAGSIPEDQLCCAVFRLSSLAAASSRWTTTLSSCCRLAGCGCSSSVSRSIWPCISRARARYAGPTQWIILLLKMLSSKN
jgi:hypothetical protein